MSFKTFPLKGIGKKILFKIDRYVKDGTQAYQLMWLDDGYEEEFVTLSLCMDVPPREGTWIKNYGENEEVVQALEDAGFLERTGQVTQAGYAKVPSMVLTTKANEYLKK